jgi:hypothetical protein
VLAALVTAAGTALAQTGASSYITNSTNPLMGGNFNITGAGILASLTAAPTTNIAGLIVRQSSIGSPTADILDVTNSGGITNYFMLSSEGNVCIGTTAPITQFDVAGNVPSSILGSVTFVGTGTYGGQSHQSGGSSKYPIAQDETKRNPGYANANSSKALKGILSFDKNQVSR